MMKRYFKKRELSKGQAVMEFTFCIIVAMLFVHALIMAFKWSSIDLARRRIAYDDTTAVPIDENWSSLSNSPLKQLDENFFQSDNNLSLTLDVSGD